MSSRSVNLFALTGLGNPALLEIIRQQWNLLRVYTRQERGKFPHYAIENISQTAQSLGVCCEIVPQKGPWKVFEPADLNLIVSYHRILKPEHLSKAQVTINIHPSLLPSYRGPTPTNWIIHHKEKVYGLTAYLVNEEVDEGPIIFQKEFPLNTSNDSALRRELGTKIPETVEFLLRSFPKYKTLQSPYKESSFESYYKFFPEALPSVNEGDK